MRPGGEADQVGARHLHAARTDMTRTLSRTASLALVGIAAATIAACSPPAKDADTPSPTGAGSSNARPPPRRPPPTSAAWTRWSPPPRRRARSTSSPSRRTGRTTARSSRASRPKYGDQGQQRPARRVAARTRSRGPAASRARTGRPTSSTSAPPSRPANTAMFAPYKVADLDKIPADLKDPNGLWVNDYGGYMSIGYDSAKVPARRPRRPAQARVQGQGRAQRRPDQGRRRLRRRA